MCVGGMVRERAQVTGNGMCKSLGKRPWKHIERESDGGQGHREGCGGVKWGSGGGATAGFAGMVGPEQSSTRPGLDSEAPRAAGHRGLRVGMSVGRTGQEGSSGLREGLA